MIDDSFEPNHSDNPGESKEIAPSEPTAYQKKEIATWVAEGIGLSDIQKKINTDFVIQDKKNGTGVGMPLFDASGDNSIVIIPRANTALTAENINQSYEAIANSDILLLQLEVPIEASQRAAEIAKENSTIVILNPAPAREIPDTLLDVVDILTPNESETEILSGISATTEKEAKEAARIFMDKGVETVILTLGSRGSLLLTANVESFFPANQVDVVDTTAAGDAFCGALAASLANGSTIEEAVKIGNAAGALAVTKLGAEPSLPKKVDLDRFLAIN